MLAVAATAVTGATAGCAGNEDPPADCRLSHEVVDSSDGYGDPHETYGYGELSDEAKRAVDAALENGSHSTTADDPGSEPPEFRYWDTTTLYAVTRDGETYYLLTYSGEGCQK
ncbi:hypothetical protein SAMN05444422_104353 [Halobiforma haloterrestris]|uniref:DUF7979 domain-containing protein n=2 Tax=Natronobacterium haloterrestre TaxID=148448 RepID=A0A1I1GJ92_NATHA|nr:hypothetical protein SAMN05444422_104353 [Halobiforma haloterrestris]